MVAKQEKGNLVIKKGNRAMNLNIRRETKDDHYRVEEITRDAFWAFWEDDREICDEHFLVSKLRNAQALVPELNCVAELDGVVVGHIIFTECKVVSEDGTENTMLTFGPLTVAPEYQSRGIGRALMKHTFEIAKELGYRAVLIFGIPDYYPRVGFKRAAEFGLTDADGNVYDPFMAYPLYEGALDGTKGKCCIDPVYYSLTQEETLEFDKKFPKKEPHKSTPISILTQQLKPAAAKAIEDVGYKTLDILKSVSEREIASKPGIDKKALETIRRTMKTHNLPWGE